LSKIPSHLNWKDQKAQKSGFLENLEIAICGLTGAVGKLKKTCRWGFGPKII
jgi:hypothetical protein